MCVFQRNGTAWNHRTDLDVKSDVSATNDIEIIEICGWRYDTTQTGSRMLVTFIDNDEDDIDVACYEGDDSDPDWVYWGLIDDVER